MNTKIKHSNSSLRLIYEYETILDMDNTQNLRKTIENWELCLNFNGVVE